MSVSTRTSGGKDVMPQVIGPVWWPLILSAATFVILYRSVIFKLTHDWWTLPDFSHGIFVPAFAGYLIYKKRVRLAQVKIEPSWSGLAILTIALLMFIAGQLGAELFVSRISLLFGLGGLVVFFLGWKMMWNVLFPWLFLFLMVPIPALIFNHFTFPLQLLTSQLASFLLPLFNVPVLREGNIIHLPSMPLEVAEACSGIRSLMTLGTLAVVYAYFAERNLWRRIALIVTSIPVAVAANSLRIVGTGLCVQYWNPDLALGFFHEFSGWAIFMASVVMLYVVHGALRRLGRNTA